MGANSSLPNNALKKIWGWWWREEASAMRDVICRRRMCVFFLCVSTGDAECLKDCACLPMGNRAGRQWILGNVTPTHTHFSSPLETERQIGLKSTQVIYPQRDSDYLPPPACIFTLSGLSNFLKSLLRDLICSPVQSETSTCLMWTVGWHCPVCAQPDQEAASEQRDRDQAGEVWCL